MPDTSPLAELLTGLPEGSEDLATQITSTFDTLVQSTVASSVAAAIETEVAGLKKKNSELLGKNKNLKDNQIPDGFDATKYQDMLDAESAREHKVLEDKQAWDKLREKLIGKHDEAMLGQAGEVKVLRKALDTVLVDNLATSAISEAQGNVALLLPHVKSALTVVEADGEFTTRVLDSDGTPRLDDKGEAFSVTALVNEMKANDTFAPAFFNPNSGGGAGGASGGAGGATGAIPNPFKKGTAAYNLTNQAIMKRDQPEMAVAMAKAAGVKL